MSDEANAASLELAISNKMAEIVAHSTSKPGATDGTGVTIAWQAYYDGLQGQLEKLIQLRPLIAPYEIRSYGGGG